MGEKNRNRRRTDQERRARSRTWVIVVVLVCLIGSLGCSLSKQFIDPQVLALGPAGGPDDLPTRTPWPTFTPSVRPSITLAPTSTPWPTLTPTNTAIPTSTPIPASTPIPTSAPAPVAAATVTFTPVPTRPPPPTSTRAPARPTATPPPTPIPAPSFDYMVAEIYKEYTSNSFLTGYVAIVNAQEIPIGGVKVVGSFDPGGYTHESPLSKWQFEGYTAPGAVTKTSSVKFEPPFGFLAGIWTIHLQDEGGRRLSEDVPITIDPDSPEWFFVKFRQPG